MDSCCEPAEKKSRSELRIETLEAEAALRNQKKKSSNKPPKYLTKDQMNKLLSLAKNEEGEFSDRNALMIKMAFHYGLRASEICNMKWEQLNLKEQTIQINRLKESRHSSHILDGEELRGLKKLKRTDDAGASYVFLSREGAPLHRRQFHRIVADLGRKSGFPITIGPHTLRHSCGFKLANEGSTTRDIQAYLGHSQINNTMKYTEISPARLRGMWKN